MGYQPIAAPKANAWEKWFAWHPVTVDGKRVVGKTVFRRKAIWRPVVDQATGKITPPPTRYDPPVGPQWEYGTLFDVLRDAE